jgi:hypothetical protein
VSTSLILPSPSLNFVQLAKPKVGETESWRNRKLTKRLLADLMLAAAAAAAAKTEITR